MFQFFVCTIIMYSRRKRVGVKQTKTKFRIILFSLFVSTIWTFVLIVMSSSFCCVHAYTFRFTLAILPVKSIIFLNQKIYFMLRYICNRPNDGLNSDKDKDSEEGTGPPYISAGQVIAQTDFRIDFGTHITNNLEAERGDVKNVNDMQNEAHS